MKFDDITAHFRDLEADVSLPDRVDVILDLSDMDNLPGSTQLQRVTGELARLQAKLSWGAFAMVASRDALFGMIRMFHAHAEGYFEHSAVFRTRDEADRWLATVRGRPF